MTAFGWGIFVGIVGVHLVYFLLFALIWWRVISQDKQQPMPATEIDRLIVRDIGTLTISRRN